MPTAVGAARGPRHVFTERCMTELCMADPKSHRTVPGDPPGALHARWVHQGRGTEIPGTGKGLMFHFFRNGIEPSRERSFGLRA